MPSMGFAAFLIFVFFLSKELSGAVAASVVAVSPASSPRGAPSESRPAPSFPLDPKQLLALHSLNIPTSKNPCTSPATACDSSAPYSHLVSLSLANCSDDVALSVTALKSLSTLKSLAFINCPISPIRFPPELTSNLHSFTCINSLTKLTGVWLSRLQNVTDLTVAGVSVNASGPSIILSGMKLLRSVTLSRCDLGGTVPRHWHPNLTFIDLSDNHLRGKIPSSLTRLESLVHLNLSANLLNESIPSNIGDLISLQNLSLALNTISGPIPDSLAALPELTHLDLHSNQLDGTIPDFLKDMKKLRYLNLERNNFHGVLPFNATFIRNMEVFKVGANANLCYNRSLLGPKVKLGIYPCDKHGKPILPPPSKDSSSEDSADDDYSNLQQPKHHSGPSKVVLGVAIGLSSIVFLIVFLVCLSKCCR